MSATDHHGRQILCTGIDTGHVLLFHTHCRTAASHIAGHRVNVLHMQHGKGFLSHLTGCFFQIQFSFDWKHKHKIILTVSHCHQCLVYFLMGQPQLVCDLYPINKFTALISHRLIWNLHTVQHTHGIRLDLFLFCHLFHLLLLLSALLSLMAFADLRASS